MNDFVALLLAVLSFCLAYWVLGLAVRLAIRLDLGSLHLGEGNLAQLCLAAAAAVLVWRRAVRHRVSGTAIGGSVESL
jgi:hypothetical protein